MTILSRRAMLGIAAAALSAGPLRAGRRNQIADLVVVFKSKRQLFLYKDGEAFRRFPMALGWAPIGDKEMEGDGKTPEGVYYIDRQNPNSRFHLSLGISYPDPNQRAAAAAKGINPGGDIFIHGHDGAGYGRRPDDWTAGCIAVTNRMIETIWRQVPVGTPIVIRP